MILELLFLVGVAIGYSLWPIARDRFFPRRKPFDILDIPALPEETFICISCGSESTPKQRIAFMTESYCCKCAGCLE